MFTRAFLVGASSFALSAMGVQAADLIIPTTPQPIYEAAGFSWDGLYIGARAGGSLIGANNLYGGVFPLAGTSASAGVIGAAVGANFMVSDPFLVGAEITGDYLWYNGASTSEFFANLRAGALVTDSALVYAIAGVGVQTGSGVTWGVYQLGGGIEFAVTEAVSVRGEVVGQGDFDGAGDPFFESAKATVGAFFHF